MVRVTTQEYDYNISYIGIFYNMPPQAKGEESTRSLKQKVVNEVVGHYQKFS